MKWNMEFLPGVSEATGLLIRLKEAIIDRADITLVADEYCIPWDEKCTSGDFTDDNLTKLSYLKRPTVRKLNSDLYRIIFGAEAAQALSFIQNLVDPLDDLNENRFLVNLFEDLKNKQARLNSSSSEIYLYSDERSKTEILTRIEIVIKFLQQKLDTPKLELEKWMGDAKEFDEWMGVAIVMGMLTGPNKDKLVAKLAKLFRVKNESHYEQNQTKINGITPVASLIDDYVLQRNKIRDGKAGGNNKKKARK